MYLEHFGLGEPPFRITPHTEFFFSGANRGATLDALLYAATHDEGIIKISGEVGSGKTMLCRVLMERLPTERVAIVYLSNPSLSREDILYAIADELGLEFPDHMRPSSALKVLQNHLISLYGEGRRVVVLIDEAHAMPVETLEEIRLLSNLESNRNKLLQLVLFGQPELNDILARADMRQLKERITHNFALEPLVRDDVAEYLEFRMRAAGYKGPNVFSPPATRLIYAGSKGLTRRVNILADKSLLAAFAQGTYQITAKEVRAAIRDSDFSTATEMGKKNNRGLVAAFVALALGVVALSAVVIGKSTETHKTPVSLTAIPPAPAASSATAVPTAGTSAANETAAPAPAAKPAASTTGKVIERSRIWLAGARDERWFLQLFAVDADQQAKSDDYLQRLGASGTSMEQVHVYRSDLSGRMRLGVIYGDYSSPGEANAALRQLPSWVQDTLPYARQVRKLR